MKRNNVGVSFEQRPHDIALRADTTPMNDAHIMDAVAKALAEVFFDNARNVLRRERMQVDSVLDGKDDGGVKGGIFRIGCRHQR